MFENNFNAGFGGFGNTNVNTGLTANTGFGGNLGNSPFGGQSLIQQTYNFGSPLTTSRETGAITMEIRKVYLGMTRPQANQQRRSYDVRLSGSHVSALQEQVERYHTDALNPLALGNFLSQGKGFSFIQHSGIPDAEVSIDNGWENDRFYFNILVDVFRAGKFHKTEFISGYTDHSGVNHAGLISTVSVDPNMVFTIDRITEARVRGMNSNGQPIPLIQRSHAVIRNPNFKGLGSMQSSMYLTRPSDVMKAVDKVQLYRGMSAAADFGDTTAASYKDLDSMVTGMPMMSNATNGLIPTFASRAIKGILDSSLNEYDPLNMDGNGAGSVAAMNASDAAYSSSSFVHILNRRLANGIATSGTFTFGDLMMLDSSIDDRTEIFGRSYESGVISIPDGRSVESLGTADTISVHATAIAHSTLSLMSLAGIATLAYHATNMNTGDTEITMQACDGMDSDGMMMQRLENFKNRMKIECFNIVASDDVTYEVEVFADAFNDAFIKLTWDGKTAHYVIPTYALSSMAPVVTSNLDRLVGIAEAIDDVVDACKQVIAPNAGNVDYNRNVSIRGDGEARYSGLSGDF